MSFIWKKFLKRDSARGKRKLYNQVVKLNKQLTSVVTKFRGFKKLELKTFQ